MTTTITGRFQGLEGLRRAARVFLRLMEPQKDREILPFNDDDDRAAVAARLNREGRALLPVSTRDRSRGEFTCMRHYNDRELACELTVLPSAAGTLEIEYDTVRHSVLIADAKLECEAFVEWS